MRRFRERSKVNIYARARARDGKTRLARWLSAMRDRRVVISRSFKSPRTASRAARSRSVQHSRIIQNSSTRAEPATRAGKAENYPSKPLDRSFSLPHLPPSLLALAILPPSLPVPVYPAFFLSPSPSISLARSFLASSAPLAARSRSFSTVVRVPSFSRVYVGKALDISGRRPRETQFLGACSATLPWTAAAVAVAADQARRYLAVRLHQERKRRNRELWHNFRRRRRRARQTRPFARSERVEIFVAGIETDMISTSSILRAVGNENGPLHAPRPAFPSRE